jgi:ureidoacrylate peracid hydrolase
VHAITPLPAWAARRAAMTNVFNSLVPERTALLVIDLQQDFLSNGRPPTVRFALPIIPRVNLLIAAAREAGSTVIFLRQTFSDAPEHDLPAWQKTAAEPILAFRERMTEGQPGHRLFDDLDVRTSDLIIDKYRQSAFIPGASTLEAELRARDIDTLIITGAMTNACCEATARDGFGLGFRIFFISDATAALSDEEHNATLLNVAICCADVRDTQAMLDLLAAPADPGER